MKTLLLTVATLFAAPIALAQSPVPTPHFQGDFFGEMPRAFGTIVRVDPRGPALEVKLERDGNVVRVPIGPDTELHFRDSWGELSDYFPGERVMLFMYVDDQRHWTYPRAVQDDLHVSARHGWFARVTRIDPQRRSYSTHREEKDGKGQVRAVDREYVVAPDAKVWKGTAATGLEGLQVGDEVIQQLVERDGKQVAVEILTRAGDDAVRAAQDARHRADQDRLGLPAYVTDLEPLSGSLTATVAWSGAERARSLKPGDAVALTSEGGKTFAASVCSLQPVDMRERIQFVVNARAAGALHYGQPLRLFMPGTGPAIPTGRLGLPAPASGR